MRGNLKKIGYAILFTCLLMINISGPIAYAKNSEQYATHADAAHTDVLLYAASPEVPEGGGVIEINSQNDWDSLSTTCIQNYNPIVIVLNTDVTLTQSYLTFVDGQAGGLNNFLLYGNGHRIDIGGKAKTFSFTAMTVAIKDTHIKNGTMTMQGLTKLSCTDSKFSEASVRFIIDGETTEKTHITGCEFVDCPEPCIDSAGAACPVSISDCNMDGCGLLYKSAYKSNVSFSDITATNCTGTVIGNEQITANVYIIESISGCDFSTSQTGITAIDYNGGAIGKITGCKITGFDTGIKLTRCNAGTVSYIDTVTISDTTITDCVTGVDISQLSAYENAMISNLTMVARKGASGTVGYQGNGQLTTKEFSSVNYDFSMMPQIKSCQITGFDTGVKLVSCRAVVSDCEISDCNSGIAISGSQTVAIVDTTLKARASAADSVGVTTDYLCYLIDCDISDFNVGSDLSKSYLYATIIGCRYKNRDKNLIAAGTTEVYDTSFTGGETSVSMGSNSGTLYFYGCVIEGDDTTQLGVSAGGLSSNSLHIYSRARPYSSPVSGYYNDLKRYTDRTVNNREDGKSGIFNCGTGINSQGIVYIGDTHIHDCETGIEASNQFIYSYGNNLIEDCRDGMRVKNLYKTMSQTQYNTFTDIHVDTVRNCSNNGIDFLNGFYVMTESGWNHRLEVYNCGNYGIETSGSGNISPATVDIHDCKTGIYIAENVSVTVLDSGSKVYDNSDWNVYNASTVNYPSIIIRGEALTGGGDGNVYTKNQVVIETGDLNSDDSVYYLGSTDTMYIINVVNLEGEIVFDTVEDGYTVGRKVAGLGRTDVTSQMFAKKEGFVILSENDGIATYAVFAAGCNVTYDVTTNGGDTFSGEQTRISYLEGDDVDLTYTASKAGYEFVGWNTDKNATEGLATLTAGRENITLYAIYKKTAYINYNTYDAASDYRTAITFYNNQKQTERELATYNAGGDNTFAGYVLDKDAAVSSADDLMKAGDNVTVPSDGLDVYCVYAKQGQLDYLKKDGTILSTDRITVYQISSDNKNFVYTVRAGESVAGFKFTGWNDEAGKSFAAGDTLITEKDHIVLTPVYKVNDEPATETPTTEEPTTETSTTETPTTEETTTPKTGDSAAPGGVIGLGILSLLGILGLSMENKRKN